MTHIGPRPTPEMYATGLEIDCQCARCGSSMDTERCEECDGYETGPWYRCLSSPEWCEANPLPGRDEVPRGAIEWFTVEVEP